MRSRTCFIQVWTPLSASTAITLARRILSDPAPRSPVPARELPCRRFVGTGAGTESPGRRGGMGSTRFISSVLMRTALVSAPKYGSIRTVARSPNILRSPGADHGMESSGMTDGSEVTKYFLEHILRQVVLLVTLNGSPCRTGLLTDPTSYGTDLPLPSSGQMAGTGTRRFTLSGWMRRVQSCN